MSDDRLLAIDAGNTQTVFGLFEGERLRAAWRLPTRRDSTADELGLQLRALFDAEGIDRSAVSGVILASVVPDLGGALDSMCRSFLGTAPLLVGPGIRTGLPIRYDSPQDVGADRIVNAVAAVERFGAPVMVLDFGTATTLDVVSPRGEYVGGIIAPGPKISAEALFARAARLSRVDICRPARVIGNSTGESVRSGLYHGYVGMVEGLVSKARAELEADAPVVATGGLASVFERDLTFLSAVDPDLTLTGLAILWSRNAG